MRNLIKWLPAFAIVALLTVSPEKASAQYFPQNPYYGGFYAPQVFSPGVYNPYSGRVVTNFYNFASPFGPYASGETSYSPYTGNYYSSQRYGNPVYGTFGTNNSFYNPYSNRFGWYRYAR